MYGLVEMGIVLVKLPTDWSIHWPNISVNFLVKLPTDWSHSSVSCGPSPHILPNFAGNESVVFAVFCWCFITEVWLPNVQRFLWTNPLWAKSGKVGGERFDHVKVRFFIGETTRRFFVMCKLARRGKAIWIYESSLDSFEWLRTRFCEGFRCCPTCAFVDTWDCFPISLGRFTHFCTFCH